MIGGDSKFVLTCTHARVPTHTHTHTHFRTKDSPNGGRDQGKRKLIFFPVSTPLDDHVSQIQAHLKGHVLLAYFIKTHHLHNWNQVQSSTKKSILNVLKIFFPEFLLTKSSEVCWPAPHRCQLRLTPSSFACCTFWSSSHHPNWFLASSNIICKFCSKIHTWPS